MDIFSLFLLLGGLGLFLFGMKLMSDGLEAAAGDKMRRWLEVLTKNRFAGVAVGTGATMLVQSSSAITVMVVGFVNAGLMSLSQAVSVCMGANIGTTITAQIVAFKVTDFAPLVLFLGVVIAMFVKDKTWQKIGQIIVGFGVLFMGMDIMAQATAPLAEWAPFGQIISTFTNPFIGILAGMVFTAIIQSSSATMGVLLALASTGIISLDTAIYVILGTNIGTCITAVLASIGANKTARRTAVVHVLFNVFGTILFVILLQFLPIKDWVYNLSPGDVQRQLANFHTIFNVVTTAILIWFPQLLIKLSYLIVRGEDPKTSEKKLQYILDKPQENPTIGVGMAIKEVIRMGKMAEENFRSSIAAFHEKDTTAADKVKETEEVVNFLNHSITDYLSKVSQEELGKKDSNAVSSMFHLVCDIERISDHAENMAEFTYSEVEQKISFSEVGQRELDNMIDRVLECLHHAINALATGDEASAHKVIEIEKVVDDLEIRLKDDHVERLLKGECSPEGSMIYADMVTNLERVADHSTNIAYRVLEAGIYN